MGDRKPVDWETVEREYRAGMLSLREIGRRNSLTEGAIRKKAKAEGWQRVLADKVREAVREKLVRIDSTQSGTQAQRASDAGIVDGSSNIGVEVQLTHRRDLQQLRAIGAILADRLAAFLRGETPDGHFIGDKESVGDLFEKLARVKSRLIPLERQAHNLDDEGANPEPATKGDIVVAVRKLSGAQREQLRSIAEAIAGKPEADA